jgi:hypothetical protein
LSFHAEDQQQVNGMRLMAHNQNLDFDFNDQSVRTPINSEQDDRQMDRVQPVQE